MVVCNYCNEPAELVTGKEIYPHVKKLHQRKYYLCRKCEAYVGVVKGFATGLLANRELRLTRQITHGSFDRLWKSGHFMRNGAYQWLALKMNKTSGKCHIAMFTLEECREALKLVREYLTIHGLRK
jgi:hypothetical protein